VAVYEITIVYPDRAFEAHHQILTEVGRRKDSGLIGFHRYRGGVALTVQVSSARGLDAATEMARQRVAAFWPEERPAEAS
jgi:hypothetical protein